MKQVTDYQSVALYLNENEQRFALDVTRVTRAAQVKMIHCAFECEKQCVINYQTFERKVRSWKATKRATLSKNDTNQLTLAV
jgi:hypothetical protein